MALYCVRLRYDEAKEGTPFEQLPDDWACPVCNAPKSEFEKVR